MLFGVTLAWMISLVQRRRRLADTTAVLDGALWTIMGSAIVLLWRGQPLLAPDVATVGALLVLVVAWVIGLFSVISRQPVHQT